VFFKTIVSLIGGTNKQGYFHALVDVFGSARKSPWKGSLSKVRSRVSFTFFQDILRKLISDFESKRRTYRGLKIYAVDGLQVHLPRTDNVVKAGYSGRAVSKYRESYTPRMYLVHAYDVLSQVTKDLRESHLLNELAGAKNMVKHFERDSLTLYDRLYISANMILAHKQAGNYFLMRARRSSFKAIRIFYSSKKQKSGTSLQGVQLKLIKVKNPRSGEKDVFVTNLPTSWCEASQIQMLYNLRWEVETSFKDLVDTMKIQQWHSKSINGIRQELYCTFWLMNYTRILMNKCSKTAKIALQSEYFKPNFKLVVDWIKSHTREIFKRKRGLKKEIRELMKKSTEKRIHYSRSYPRIVKGPASNYPYRNTIWIF